MRSLRGILYVIFLIGCFSTSRAEVLVRISQEESATYQLTEIDEHVWLAAQSGAYRLDGQVLNKVMEEPVYVIAEVGAEIWFGTERGTFRADQNQSTIEPVPCGEDKLGNLAVTAIMYTDGIVWIGTDRGLFRFVGQETDQILSDDIKAVVEAAGEIWVGSTRNAYRMNAMGEERSSLFKEPKYVSKILKVSGALWFITYYRNQYGPAYRLRDGLLKDIYPDGMVSSIAEVEGELWLATLGGVFRLENDDSLTPIDVPGLDELVNTATIVADQTWLGTTRRAFRRTNQGFTVVSVRSHNLDVKEINVKQIVEVNEVVWLRAKSGLFRFDPEVKIQVRPKHAVTFQTQWQ